MILNKELVYQLKVLCDMAATDESRPILTTLHIEAEPNRAYLVTADGYRLSAMCLPIQTETEETITLNVEAKAFKKLLTPKTILGIEPGYISINGVRLPDLDVGKFPLWRSILPRETEPRASMAAFKNNFVIDFLKFRLGRGYNKGDASVGDVSASPMITHYSIYDGDSCGMKNPNAWAWAEPVGDEAAYFIHILMPLDTMESQLTCSFDNDVNEARIEEFKQGHVQLEKLLRERFSSGITSVTGPLVSEIWGRKE